MDDLLPALDTGHEIHNGLTKQRAEGMHPAERRLWLTLVASCLLHLTGAYALITYQSYWPNTPYVSDTPAAKPPVKLTLKTSPPQMVQKKQLPSASEEPITATSEPKQNQVKQPVSPPAKQKLKQTSSQPKKRATEPTQTSNPAPATESARVTISPPPVSQGWPAVPPDSDSNGKTNGTVFNPTLKQQISHARAQSAAPSSLPRLTSYTSNSGQEIIVNGDSCNKIVQATDDHDQTLWQIGSRCAWVKSESEQFMDRVNKAMKDR